MRTSTFCAHLLTCECRYKNLYRWPGNGALGQTPRLVSLVSELLFRGHLYPSDLTLYLAQLRFYAFLAWCYLGDMHRRRSSATAAKDSVTDPYVAASNAEAEKANENDESDGEDTPPACARYDSCV